MNILKNYTNDKQILQEYFLALNIDFSKIPSNYRKDKDFLRNCKYGLLTSANCNLEQLQAQNQTEANRRPKRLFQAQSQKQCQGSFIEAATKIINLPVRDKSGLHKFLNIVRGNTLIIGGDQAALLDRSIELHKIYLKSGFITRPISFRAFTALSFDEQTNPEIHYIVRFNKHNDIDDLPYQLSTMFSNIFVFTLSGISEYGEYNTQLRIDAKVGNILSRLTINCAHARKYLLASLQENEFLIIDGVNETFASISNADVCG